MKKRSPPPKKKFFFSFFAHKKLKKPPSKVAHNRLQFFFFMYWPGCPNRPRIDFSCHKYVPRRICSLICDSQHMNGPKINAETILLPKNAIYGTKKGISLCNLKIGQSSLIFLQIHSQLVDLQVGFSVVLFYRHLYSKQNN